MSKDSDSRDVPVATRVSDKGIKFSAQSETAMQRTAPDQSFLMRGGREIDCPFDVPVAIVLDVSGSFRDQVCNIKDRSVRIAGQLQCQKYYDNPGCSIAAIDDAWTGDNYPIQVSDFTADPFGYTDSVGKIFIEGGGGGNARESYDLAMFTYARRVKYRPSAQKGFLFFLGDEGFFDTIKPDHLQRHFGVVEAETISTAVILAELQERFHVYRLHVDTSQSNYDYASIRRQWQKALGADHFFRIDEDPNAAADIMLGCIALTSGTRNLDSYDVDLAGQVQTAERRAYVRKLLAEKFPPMPTGTPGEAIGEIIGQSK